MSFKHLNISSWLLKPFGIFLMVLLSQQGTEAKMRIFTHVDTTQFPPELKQNLTYHPWEKGFLDVSKPPYNAAQDGMTDATAAIQSAIDHAYACNLVVFVPHGTYLVSDQLQCYLDPGPQLPNNPISSASQRKFGHIILGSEKDGQRPVIRLQDGSTVKDNTLFVFKYYDSQTGTEDASRHYLGSLRNFEIDMGDNAGISAVYNNGAQLCALENLKIYGNFDMGISTLPGSGGYTANIEIIGGRIGIYQNNFRPNPTLFNIRLENQSECGLMVLDTRGSLTMAGFSIVSGADPSASYRAVYIKNTSDSPELGARANLNLVDGSIEHHGTFPAIYNYQQDLVIRNVFLKSGYMVESGAYSGSPEVLAGDGSRWLHLAEYVFATAVDMGSVYRDKVNQRTGNKDYIAYSELNDSLPPSDLLSRHGWGEMPSWMDSSMVDLVLDYHATRDDTSDDDAPVIQQAIDDISDPGHPDFGKTLFIPRGHFHIKSPIVLKAGVKMMGAAKNISVIMVGDDWIPSSPVSAVSTADEPGPGVILTDLAIVTNHPNPRVGLENQKFITALDLRTGWSVIRDVQTSLRNIDWGDNVYWEPIVRVDGHGGGKIYGLCLDEGTQGFAEPGYRLLKLENASSPVTFYQLSVEDASVEQPGEQTVHMEIDSCREVTVFGFKYEKESELLHVQHSGSLTIIGGSGNYGLKDPEDEAIITISNTPDVFIANISRHIQTGEITGKSFLVDGNLSLTGDAPIVLYSKMGDSLPDAPDTFRLEFIVAEQGSGNPVIGAAIGVAEEILYTDAAGTSEIRLPERNYAYSVSAAGYLACIDSVDLNQDTIIFISFQVNSADGTREADYMKIYPNPVRDEVTLIFQNLADHLELNIADISGHTIKSRTVISRTGEYLVFLDMSDMNPGLYLVHLKSMSGVRTFKFVKL